MAESTTPKYREIVREVRSKCVETVQTIDLQRFEKTPDVTTALEVLDDLEQFLHAVKTDLGAI